MKRKLISALLCGAMAATMLAGCGSSSSDSSSTADSGSATTSESGTTADSGSAGGATGTGKIGISMPTQSLERWNRDGSYLDEQFQAAGYETIVTYSDNDSSRQVNDIQNMLAEDVDLLIVAAIDGGL